MAFCDSKITDWGSYWHAVLQCDMTRKFQQDRDFSHIDNRGEAETYLLARGLLCKKIFVLGNPYWKRLLTGVLRSIIPY